MIIVSSKHSEDLAQALAKKTRSEYSQLTVKEFPDGDLYLKFNTEVKGKTVVIVRSFQPLPNTALYTTIFIAETAKDLGAKEVILVAPYLAFMRQDKRFNPGEAVSSKIMAKLLNNSVDKLITIDPHLHRYKSLKDIFKIPAIKITANELIGDYVKKNVKDPVIIGPDWESYQWAEKIANRINVPSTVLRKTRHSYREVSVKVVKPIEIKGKNAVIVDDIISTGNTIAEAAKQAKKQGAKSITAIGVHGLLIENAVTKLKRLEVKVVTTNTIKHKTNEIDVVGLIADELR